MFFMESPLTGIVAGWQDLTDEEIEVARTTEGLYFDTEDLYRLYVLKNVSPDRKSFIYESFIVMPEYHTSFMKEFQKHWMKKHEKFLEEQGYTHLEANGKIAMEIASHEGTSENVRCKLFYAMKYPERLEFDNERGRIQLGSLIELSEFAMQNHPF